MGGGQGCLQGVCARLRDGARNGTGTKFSNAGRVLISFGSEPFPYGFISHEVQADLDSNQLEDLIWKRKSIMYIRCNAGNGGCNASI